MVLKLNKNIYGLKEVRRLQQKHIPSNLTEMVFDKSKVNQCVWCKSDIAQDQHCEEEKVECVSAFQSKRDHEIGKAEDVNASRLSRDGAIHIAFYVEDCVTFSKSKQVVDKTLKEIKDRNFEFSDQGNIEAYRQCSRNVKG